MPRDPRWHPPVIDPHIAALAHRAQREYALRPTRRPMYPAFEQAQARLRRLRLLGEGLLLVAVVGLVALAIWTWGRWTP